METTPKKPKQISKKLGEILTEAGLVTEKQLQKSIELQKKTGKRLGEALVDLGFITEAEMTKTLSVQLGIPYLDPNTSAVEPEAIETISEELAKKHLILPVRIDNNVLTVAMADPLNFDAIKDIGFVTDRHIRPAVGTPTKIKDAIARYYHLAETLGEVVDKMPQGFVEMVAERIEICEEDEDNESVEDIIKQGEAPPIIRMVNSILYNAVMEKASDIHIEPQEKALSIRHRVDGLLREVERLPKWVQGTITSRVKIMARMDIAEKRIPQDGRIKLRIDKREIDLRISTLPIQYGEDIVIRILDAQTAVLELEDLGLSKNDAKRFTSIASRSQGTVLITGPTGSGKSSSLYAMLNHIQNDQINIITLENPIEYELKGAKQVNINEKTGLTFAFGLRSVLRQDPDIIMVGEMRDTETASIAFQASLTGHLMLSTLHTNTAVSAITRLLDLGIQPYLIASSINGIIGQRLVRRLCTACKKSYQPSADVLLRLGIKKPKKAKLTFYRGTGCEQCNNTGYRGRLGVFEILVCTQPIRELISAGASEGAVMKEAVDAGMRLMTEDAMDKVLEGVTSTDEILRVLYIKGEEEVHVCSSCGGSVRSDFISCPYCGETIIERCPGCDRTKEPDWKHCPYCCKTF